jgi:serine/threonine protein kinase
MRTSVDDFLKRLADSDLLPQADLQALLDDLPDLDRSQDAQQLAQALVRQKKLSRFQAQAIYQGRTRGLVLGNYVLLEKIGAGGMGQVYKAEHRRMKRVVAIKVLPPHIVKSPDTLRRFQREVEAAARLEHPNIVTAHDADEFQGVHFLVMQYVDGSDLSSIVRKHGPFPLVKAIELAIQIGKGLQHAHDQGIVHRDIKPANVLLDIHGAVKILDMGLARFEKPAAPSMVTAPENAAATELTMSGSVIGTIDYMSPEQAMDAKTSDHRSDIYSLGCTLHFLLTGRPVYGGDNFLQRLVAHREAPLPSLTNVPVELNATFRRMIAKTPDDRYQHIAEAMRDLERSSQAAQAWAKGRHAAGAVGTQDQSPDAAVPAALKALEETIIRTDVPIDSPRLRQLLDDDFSVDAAKISLRQKNVSDADLAELSGMSNLEALDLEGTPITDAGLAYLSRLSHLRRLDLSGTSVTDRGLGRLESLSGLRRLFLAETAVTDAGLPHLARFTQLNRLSLSGTSISDAGLAHLAGLRHLASLDLSYTRITDKGLAYLKHLSALEEIDLSGTRVTAAGVRALVRLLPKTEIML